MIVLARTGLSEKSRPLVSVRRIMICKTGGSAIKTLLNCLSWMQGRGASARLVANKLRIATEDVYIEARRRDGRRPPASLGPTPRFPT